MYKEDKTRADIVLSVHVYKVIRSRLEIYKLMLKNEK